MLAFRTNRAKIALIAAICLVIAGMAVGVAGYMFLNDSRATCDPTERYYDATWVINDVIPEAQSETWEYRYDGNEYYGEATIDGVTRVETSEGTGVDDIDYRGFCGPLETDEGSGHYALAGHQYRYAGEEKLDGATVKRYENITLPPPEIPEDAEVFDNLVTANVQETLFVNQTGHIVRIDVILTTTLDGAELQRTEYEIRLSGYGEPNSIPDPRLSTPTPLTSN